MKKIFIIGSTGYIGSRLLVRLNGTEEISVTSVGRGRSTIPLDLATGDKKEFVDSVSDGDSVVFLASVSSPEICRSDPDLAWRVNVENTGELISELAKKGARVIFSSSDVVFGSNAGPHADDDELCPFGGYGDMKAAVETRFIDNPRFKAVRFSYVLGPGDKYSEMLAQHEVNQEEVEVFSGFERSVVSLADVLDGIIRLIGSWDSFSHAAVNFAGPALESRERITELMAEQLYPGLKYRVVEAPKGFWDSRPKAIEMQCGLFSQLLGRMPVGLEKIIENWSIK